MATPDPQLVDLLTRWIDAGRDGPPPLIGVAGSQASGKSTLCKAVADATGAAWFSIDDAYLTKAERRLLAVELHPLFAVRGPPGTHDLALARRTIAELRAAGPDDVTLIPVFDKLADDRLPQDRWVRFEGRPSAVLVDGWCVGAMAQGEAELQAPVNALEAQEDPDGLWRRTANAALAGDYGRWWDEFDHILYLAPPSFEVVLDWRCEQEAGLMGIQPADLPPERRAALARFVSHYERLTVHMLNGGVQAEATARLARDRSVLSLEIRREKTGA